MEAGPPVLPVVLWRSCWLQLLARGYHGSLLQVLPRQCCGSQLQQLGVCSEGSALQGAWGLCRPA